MKGFMLTGLVGAGLLVLAAGSGATRDPVARPTGRVGKYWTWEELMVSTKARELGLDNTPPLWARRNLAWMVRHVLDPLRERYGHDAVRVNSAYRSPAVNRAVGGVKNSLHIGGLAVDLAGEFLREPAAVERLRATDLKVIVYPRHVHVEASVSPRKAS